MKAVFTHVAYAALIIMVLGVGCQPSMPTPAVTTASPEQSAAPPKTDAELVRRVKLAVDNRCSPEEAAKLVGQPPKYDSEGSKNGVEFFDFVKGLEDEGGGTIAMADIATQAKRVQFWRKPEPRDKDDISVPCVGIVWKKDGAMAHFNGRYVIY